MPDSIADICNRALSEIGARAEIVDLSESSKEATTCRIWYDNTRTTLLHAAHWGFARRTEELSLLGTLADGTSQYPWRYKYTYPADCSRLRYILASPFMAVGSGVVVTGDQLLPNNWMPSRGNRFIVGNDRDYGRVILSNVENALAVYTADITDPSDWDQGFVNAMSSALAASIVIPITGNAGMKQTFEQLAASAIAYARAQDDEARPSIDHTPDWISARGDGATYGSYGVLGAPGSDIGMWYQGYDTSVWGM